MLVAALAAGYQLWLRNSSLVAVEEVTVSGAEQHPSLESALRSAALEQTTLNLDLAALELAVADDPTVRGVSARADFPHALAITVNIREPVAYLKAAGVLVAADGVVLGRAASADGLPTIDVDAAAGPLNGSLRGAALRVARVLGAAPAPLLAEVDVASVDPRYGVIVELAGGLELRFGGPEERALKWRAAAAVLADPELETATYLDLNVPERPVAGGVPERPATAGEERAVDATALAPAAAADTAGGLTETAEGSAAVAEAATEPPPEGGLATVE